MTGITNNVDPGRNQILTYDPLNRILSAQSSATSGADCWGQVFGPNGTAADDALGNFTNINSGTQTQPPCQFGMLTVSVDGNNHITNSGFAYDATGNMTQDGSGTGYSYAFDAENRLVQANGMSGGPYCYIYDGKGLRVAKKSNSNTSCTTGTVVQLYWRALAGNALAETDGSGNTLNEYVFFRGRRVASRNGSGAIFYYFADQVGSTRSITTGSGTGQTPGQLCYDADFTPYGQEMSHSERLQTTACPPNYKFTGYERDSETGLDYAFARYYSSRLGRFLSTDPLGGSIGSLQSNNAYTYVENNPANGADPSGLRCYIVVFGFLDDKGKFNSLVPPSASAYPYDQLSLVGDVLSIMLQSTLGVALGSSGLVNAVNQNQNEPGGIDLIGFSGGAQVISTAADSGKLDTSNISSTTYLSPGLGFLGDLYTNGDSQSFKGSGFKDFLATFNARLNGVKLNKTGAKGHDFKGEFQSAPVQNRLNNLEAGTPRPCGSGGGIILNPMGGDFGLGIDGFYDPGGYYVPYELENGDGDGGGFFTGEWIETGSGGLGGVGYLFGPQVHPPPVYRQ